MRGFTLIELLVSITISVILLAILAMVFQISTKATRTANMRISMTERIRAMNIRLRQEIGNMLDKPRLAGVSKDKTYDVSSVTSSKYLTFSTATDEDGRPVNVDVMYEYVAGSKPEDGKLVRRRDTTGPYILDANGQLDLDSKTKAPKPNATDKYILGDDQFFQKGMDAMASAQSTVLMSNVRSVSFRVIDPPLAPTDPALQSQLNPRTLPAGIEMTIQYGPEAGDIDNLEITKIAFPVYRGL